MKDLEALLSKRSAKNKLLKKQLEGTQADLRKLELDKQVIQHDLQISQSTCERLSEMIKDSEEKNILLTKEISFKESKLSNIDNTKKLLNAAIEKNAEEKKKLQKKVSQLENSLSDAQHESSQLSTELARLKHEYFESRKSYELRIAQLEHNEQKAKDLEAFQNELESERNQLIHQINLLSEQLNNSKNQVQFLEAHKGNLFEGLEKFLETFTELHQIVNTSRIT